MEHNSRKFLQSYQLLDPDRGNNHVAEEPAGYDVDVSAGNGGTLSSKTKPCPSKVSSTAAGVTTDRAKEGQTLRLAMALVEGTQTSADDRQANINKLRILTQRASGQGTNTHADTDNDDVDNDDDDALIERLHQLVRANDRNLAEQLSLYLCIDERELWRKAGCRDCLHWMDRELGIHRTAAYERLRAARALRSLPVIESLFTLGKLGWSKVRELTRVATPANEHELTAAALELGASETHQLCQRWRHAESGSNEIGPGGAPDDGPTDAREADEALRAFEQRSLSWRALRGTSTTRITLDLPNDSAAEFLTALHAQEDELLAQACELSEASGASQRSGTPEASQASQTSQSSQSSQAAKPVEPPKPTEPAITTPRQRRADAALLMSAKALAHTGHAVANADRYRVMVTIDSRLLGSDAGEHSAAPGEPSIERPVIEGFGPISVATAQRLASQARLTVVATDTDGEVVATGRDTRLFSPSTVRAVMARDRCCQMPGCTQSRSSWLHAHHVVPWCVGGESSVSNAALLCSACHIRLHEGDLRLEPVDNHSVALPEEKLLTLNAAEQAIARARIAAVQRFRLVDAKGCRVAGPRRQAQSTSPEFPSENSPSEMGHPPSTASNMPEHCNGLPDEL